jgi:hypothetical protein
VAVGSGGSLTAAYLLANLHQKHVGKVAIAQTPLEVTHGALTGDVSLWLVTAGGNNPDIRSCFSQFVRREPRQLCVLCGVEGSPLAKEVQQYEYVDLFEFARPSGKDGFLATNSLFAFSLLITRAYAEEHDASWSPRQLLDDIFSGGLSDSGQLQKVRTVCEPLWGLDTLIVLYGPLCQVGAVDLESKFTEAALGSVKIADYRNFAHGRHHWLAKRGDKSGVIAFISPSDRELAGNTLALLPPTVPVVRIELSGDDFSVPLASLLFTLHLTNWAGSARGIDPGRPGVPQFGRRLYHLRLPFNRKQGTEAILSDHETIAIERKAGLSVERLEKRGDLPHWRNAYRQFLDKLLEASYQAIVFDYDGTLVDPRKRFEPPQTEVIQEIIRLLENGIPVGIATGRGSSVRRDLQTCLRPELWRAILIGYYNGADIGSLDDDAHPDRSGNPCADLGPIVVALEQSREFPEIGTLKKKVYQLTLEPRQLGLGSRLWDVAQQIVQWTGQHNVTIVRSSHSVDILAPGISKTLLLDRLRTTRGKSQKDMAILTIGDRGHWPGNDFQLLREPYSLSVDETSVDPLTCWNLAPRGHRGIQATLGYCRALRVEKGRAGVRLTL